MVLFFYFFGLLVIIIKKLNFNVRCEHERKNSADACITEIVGEKNAEHFFVATQDVDLRKKLQEVSVCIPISLNGCDSSKSLTEDIIISKSTQS